MNYDYFKLIDTPNKAYFLGLFHADRSCTTRQRGKHTEIRFQISLQKQDAQVLEAFCEQIGLERTRLKTYQSSRKNESDYVKLYLADRRFSSSLLDLKQKSLIDRVPLELRSHFIRGFFDGDGSIYVRRNKNKIFYYAFSFTCLGWIKDVITEHLPFPTKQRPNKRSFDLYTIESNRKGNIKALFEYMYEKAEVKLDRKYQKFKQAYEYVSTTSSLVSVGSSDPKQEASLTEEEDIV